MKSGGWVTRAAKRALELVVPVRLADLEQHPTQPVGLAALVRAVLPQGKVSCRNGALVSFCIVMLADESDPYGSISLKLWRKRADDWAGKLRAGDVVVVSGARVKRWRADVEVSLTGESTMDVLPRSPPAREGHWCPVQLQGRAREVREWADSQASARPHGAGGNVVACAPAQALLRFPPAGAIGSRENPEWCGHVCGGWCECVRAAQAGLRFCAPVDMGGGSAACTGATGGFQRIQDLAHGCTTGMGRGVAVCGRLTLAPTQSAACLRLCNTAGEGTWRDRLTATLSCGGLQDGSTAMLAVIIQGKHCTALAKFLKLQSEHAPNSPLTDQCVAQIYNASISCDDHVSSTLTVKGDSGMFLWQLPRCADSGGFLAARAGRALQEQQGVGKEPAAEEMDAAQVIAGEQLSDALGRNGRSRICVQARIRRLVFDCGERGFIRAPDIRADTLPLLCAKLACARCGGGVRVADGITLCTQCAAPPKERKGSLFRARWAPCEVLLECRGGILVSAAVDDAAMVSLFSGLRAEHLRWELQASAAMRQATSGCDRVRVPEGREGMVQRLVLEACGSLEVTARGNAGYQGGEVGEDGEQEMSVELYMDQSVDCHGLVSHRHVSILSFSFFS